MRYQQESSDEIGSLTANTTELEITLTNLNSSHYKISVRAYTNVGAGPWDHLDVNIPDNEDDNEDSKCIFCTSV